MGSTPLSIDIDVRFNEQSILEGMRKLEAAKNAVLKGTPGAIEEMERVFTKVSDGIVKVSTRAGQAQERFLRNLERESKAYGMSQLDRLIQRKQDLIKTYAGQEEAINRITVAMDREIAKERENSNEEVKRLNKQAQEAKNAMALLGAEFGVHLPRQLRTFLTQLPGVAQGLAMAFSAVAVFGLIEVVASVIGKIIQLRKEFLDMQEKSRRYFIESTQFREDLKMTALEAQIVNDQLRISIEKLEKKPVNGMQLALHETQLEAAQLNKELDEMLGKFETLADKYQKGFLQQAITFFGYQVMDPEIKKHIQNIRYAEAAVTRGEQGAPEQLEKVIATEREYFKTTLATFERKRKEGEDLAKVQGGMATAYVAPTVLTDTIEQLKDIQFDLDEREKLRGIKGQTGPLKTRQREDQDRNANLKEYNEAMSTTNRLTLERDRAQAGEANGLEKILGHRKEMMDQLKQDEIHTPAVIAYHKENIRLINETIAAELVRFNRQQEHTVKTAGAEAQLAVQSAQARAQYERYVEKRKVSGEEFGEPDIAAEYKEQMRQADLAFSQEAIHIKELRDLDRDRAEIRKAQIKASSDYAVAATNAEKNAENERDALRKKHDDDAKREAQAAFDNARALDDARAAEDRRHDRDLVQRRVQMLQEQGITRGDRPQIIAAQETLRIQAAQMEYAETERRLNEERQKNSALLTDDATTRIKKAQEITKVEEESIKAQGDLRREIDDAHYDRVKQTLELEKQQTEEIMKTLEPLYQTLLTHPSKFGDQLKNTIKDATLKPIVTGLSESTAKFLHPVIFGKDGQGGIAGMFGGIFGEKKGLKDLTLTPAGHLPVQIASVAPGVFQGAGGGGFGGGGIMPAGTNIFGIPTFGGGGTSGGGGPSWSPSTWSRMGGLLLGGGGGGGRFGGGGGTAPSFFQGADGAVARGAPAPVENMASSFGTGEMTTGGGTAELPEAAPFGVTGQTGSGGGPGIGRMFLGMANQFLRTGKIPGMSGGGGGGAMDEVPRPDGGVGGDDGADNQASDNPEEAPYTRTPWEKFASGLGGFNKTWGSPTGGTWGSTGSTIGSNVSNYGSGNISDLASSPLANTPAGGIGGSIGVSLAEAGAFGERRGTWGGVGELAAGGFLIAGPIGAAVGAAIGLGEMMAGVESPRREAKRLVKSTYGINISNDTADQIVAIAQRSYANHVSLAVRSPEVRHMLGLYAAGTGQASEFRMGSNDPHGASLVESGGRLQQQATYQYGQAYTYSSNLPIYGGVTPTQTLGAPGGNIPLQLSLNVGGSDAAKFMTGQVVTPDVISQQYASAMQSSSGRVNQSLMMSEPGAIVA